MSEVAQLPEHNADGAEWIGRVPDSWTLRPFFSVARQSRRSNKGLVEKNLLSLSYGRIINKDITANEGLLPESFETYQIVDPDDMIFRLTDLQNDKRSLRTGLVTERGIITSAYLCVTPEGINPRFFAHAMRAADHRKVFYSRGDGLRQTLKYDDLKWLWVPFPPLSEQQKVVDFVDREIAKIDAMIEKQRALVNGLRGRRQAVIRRAVLGRDKETFKPVGEESPWVREVPADWQFIPLGYRYDVVLGKMLDAGREPRTDDSDLPYVRAANIQESGLDLTSINTMPFTPSEAVKFSLRSGDLLVVEGGSVGVSVLLEKDMDGWAFQKTVNRVRSSGVSSTRYLHYVLHAYRTAGVFTVICGGSTIAHLTAEKLAALKIPLPSIAEQHEITGRLDRETARIDALIARSERLIELSQERRAALIAAAVTGQIDITTEALEEAA